MAARPVEERVALGRKGGQTTALRGHLKPHHWTRDQARAQGRKGGLARGAKGATRG